ncbi:NAD-binding protein [Streptomyces sp. CG1]|uniref:NAD-binding protein n=1 Tax=Streptomyces sp. CG1 TaxID=1287523 RepID=UPI0034E29F04
MRASTRVPRLLGQGTSRDQIVVVDPQKNAVDLATSDGLAAVHGDATRTETLSRAELHQAAHVILLKQSGANAVITSSSSPLDHTDPRAETLRGGDRLITIQRAVPQH